MKTAAFHTLAAVFPRLAPDALQQLFDAARVENYPAQFELCREGDLERSLFIIVEGRVDVYKHLEGQRLLINQLGVGEHFGDVALLLDVARTATIVTTEPTEVFEIDREIFAELVRTNPDVVLAIAKLALKRFVARQEKQLVEIARLKRRDVPAPQVFLSYARDDEAFATRLANNLLKQQIDVWLDVFRLQPGQSWARQIGEALDNCQTLLVVLSPASVASENVEDEWNYYLDHKRPIVTVQHQPCKVPYRLSKLLYVDFHEVDYDHALARLVATLNTQD